MGNRTQRLALFAAAFLLMFANFAKAHCAGVTSAGALAAEAAAELELVTARDFDRGSVYSRDACPSGAQEQGQASYYGTRGDGFRHRVQANGLRQDPRFPTAASRTYPLGSRVEVCLIEDPSKCVTVIITDRGPYANGRIIDLSVYAADQIGMRGRGVAGVSTSCQGVPTRRLSPGEYRREQESLRRRRTDSRN